MNELDMFESMSAEWAWNEFGWGVSIRPGSTVYRHEIGDTVIWVGLLDELPTRFVCEVEVGCELEGQWDGNTAYDALLNGVLNSVVQRSVTEMWDEPAAEGLRYCCEDVVNAMSYYGYETIRYGWERLDELFPNKSEGLPETDDDYKLLDDMMGHAIEYMKEYGDKYDVEFVDVWS